MNLVTHTEVVVPPVLQEHITDILSRWHAATEFYRRGNMTAAATCIQEAINASAGLRDVLIAQKGYYKSGCQNKP